MEQTSPLPFWDIHSVLSRGGGGDNLEGEDVVSRGYLVRIPVCTHSSHLENGCGHWEGTHQGDNGTFGRQLSSTEQCPNKPVNLLLLWVVFIIIWWHFGFLGKEMFSDDWPPNKNRREIIKHYQKEEITERG